MKWLGIFLLHSASLSQVAPAFYTWVERGTLRAKCWTQEHNTMSQANAQTQTTWSEVERKRETLATRSRTCPNSHFTIGELSYSVYIIYYHTHVHVHCISTETAELHIYTKHLRIPLNGTGYLGRDVVKISIFSSTKHQPVKRSCKLRLSTKPCVHLVKKMADETSIIDNNLYSHISCFIVITYNITARVNIWVTHGGWVHRNLGAGAANPKPHKPTLPTTQPWVLSATPSCNSSTSHTEPRVQWEKKLWSEPKHLEHEAH